MASERLSMRKTREILRLKELKRSHREISRVLGVGGATVSEAGGAAHTRSTSSRRRPSAWRCATSPTTKSRLAVSSSMATCRWITASSGVSEHVL